MYIDISKESGHVRPVLRKAFRRSGFARAYSSNQDHLLPCPLGTFVNKSVRDSADLNRSIFRLVQLVFCRAREGATKI